MQIAIADLSAQPDNPAMIPEPENAKPSEDQPQKFTVTGDDDLADEPAPKRQCELGDGQEGCPVCE
ncbi:MAG: hypothetical protein ACOYMS_02750 [Terrimicrobiaceae bacterium]